MGWSSSLLVWSGPGQAVLGSASPASQARQQQQGHSHMEGSVGCRQLAGAQGHEVRILPH